MTGFNGYIEGVLEELAELEKNHRKYFFRINDKVPDDYINRLKKYFKDSEKYMVTQTRKCKSCNSTWDIIIEIKY